VDWCGENHVTFKYAPDLFQAKATNVDIGTIAGCRLLNWKNALDGWGKLLSECSICRRRGLIILISPILLILALAIKLDSRGPVIYKNQRVSKEGVFNTYKFRSMKLEYCTGTAMAGKKPRNMRSSWLKKKMAEPVRSTKF